VTGLRFLAEAGIFLFVTRSRLAVGPTPPPMHLVPVASFHVDKAGRT